jgi:hypothetical protein
VCGTGCKETTTLSYLEESICVNTGELLRNVKEGEVKGNERTLELSNGLRGSQSGHSTQSQGKPGTGGRATAYRCLEC